MKARYILLVLAAIVAMVLGACAAPQAAPTAVPQAAAPTAAPQAPAPTAVPPTAAPAPTAVPATAAPAPTAVPPTAAPAAAAKDFLTWYQFDQGNVDPKADEHVGNEYLRKTIPLFNKAFEGKWNWINQAVAFDRMTPQLVTAVQSQGEVPDLMHSDDRSILTFYKNGTVQDLTDWAAAQPWFKDLDPNAIDACKGPDGKLYCIPVAEQPAQVFVWKDRFPNGYPKTPDEFMKEAERLKAAGKYAMTYFGSTDFNGDGVGRGLWSAISSFGGTYDDGKGNMLLNTPENVAAVEFLRTIVQKGYVPEIAFAGKFQEEEAFKDSSAGSIPTGFFGYRYMNPLTAPNGTKYAKGNENDFLDAVAAGDVFLAPFPAAPGKKPGCQIQVSSFVIPVGAKNPDAAKDYINWIMSPEQNADWVVGPGGGFPVEKTTQSNAAFQTPFYEQAAKVVAASACRPWYGSLQRPTEASTAIVEVMYRLIKQDPTADIAAELTKTEKAYNANN
jgi:multiple sugar transport system substrate-binding protein